MSRVHPSNKPSMAVPLIVACALFMEDLDSTIINTSLPAIGHSLATAPIDVGLAVTVYMFSLGLFIPVSGWAADRFGARRVFGTAIAIFTLGSVFCGFSQSLAFLAVSRVIQGFGGAMMVPVGRLVLLKSVEKDQLVRAITYLTVPALLGAAAGPIVGGFLTTYISWRWIFFLNVPVGLCGMMLVFTLIQNFRETEIRPFDWGGFALTGVTLIALMFGADLSTRSGQSWKLAVLLLSGGLVTGLSLIWYSRSRSAPLVDMRLFAIPTFASCIGGGSFFRISAAAIPFLIPLLMQIGFGMSAFLAGLLTSVSAIGAIAMKASVGPVLRRWGFRTVLVANGMICAVTAMSCAWLSAETPLAVIASVLFLGGFFCSLQYTSLNSLAFADVPAHKMSAASSLSSMFQQLSNGFGVAASALLFHVNAVWGNGDVGSEVTLSNIRFALYGIAIICLCSLPFFTRLPSGSGVEVIDRKPSQSK